MAYRNKTYVAFASEDILSYRLMKAWCANEAQDFDLRNAHDIYAARDTSKPETIRIRLRMRMVNTKQVIYLVSGNSYAKSRRPSSFLYFEIDEIKRLNLPVVFVNLNGSRRVQSGHLPRKLVDRYSISVPLRAKPIRYALDEYAEEYVLNDKRRTPKSGPYQYKDEVYRKLGLAT